MPPRKYLITGLTLRRVSATSPKLQNIFQALAPTLKELELEDFRLSSGSWTLMWRSMANTLQLRKIKFGSSFRAAAESWNAFPREKAIHQPIYSSSADASCTPWSHMMSDLGCFFWESKPSGNTLKRLGEWILSNGQGPFPLVPFYTPHCRDHHYPSKRVVNACSRESAVRELLADDSSDFEGDGHFYARREQTGSCPETCKNIVHEDDCIDISLYQEHYISSFLAV